MAKFTTKKRRELTSSDVEAANQETKQLLNLQFDEAYAKTIRDDKTNNGIFISLNSQVNGLSFEYRYITGKCQPALDEIKYYYKYKEKTTEEIVTDFYWDCEKLQSGARLDKGNEFHLNIREGTTVKFPIRPYKYSKWFLDTDELVKDFEVTESNMISMIRNLDNWYTNGGGTGNVETTIFGKYSEYDFNKDDEKQEYMTVGYNGYQSDPNNGYMTPGYNSTGEIILINGTDLENFSFGKIIDSKDLPSRILLDPYCKIGDIPEDAVITSTYNIGDLILRKVAEQIVFSLKKYYFLTNHYLENNPNKEDSNNVNIVTSVENVLNLIDEWENSQDRDTFPVILQLLLDIEAERPQSLLATRASYITNFLTTNTELYNKRFDIIDLRLNKNMGTLKEVMSAQKGISAVGDIFGDKEKAKEIYSNYFITKLALLDGDYYMRVFVEDDDDIAVGEWWYILTNNEDVPEIYSQVTEIVDGRIKDYANSQYNERGDVKYAYISCKKVFFGNEVFTPKYLVAERFRIVKEI